MGMEILNKALKNCKSPLIEYGFWKWTSCFSESINAGFLENKCNATEFI